MDEEDESFDYEYLGFCDFDGQGLTWEGQPRHCGEPAVARIWWREEIKLLVCQKHFDKVLYENAASIV